MVIRVIGGAETEGYDKYTIGWDEEKRKVTMHLDNRTVEIYIDERKAYENGQPMELLRQPMLVDGNVYISLTDFGKMLRIPEYQLIWNKEEGYVTWTIY